MDTQPINVKSIRPCPTNPRKHFPQQMLDDLAASLKLHGMLVPLIVREVKAQANGHAGDKKAAGKPAWELVDGECRWRAAELAGLVVVPCEVRDLTDAQVLEIQLTTFLQRSDIGDLEKAEAIQRMLEKEELTLEDAAAKIGKSVSTLRGLLGLTRCSEKMRKALSEGKIVSAVAQLVARIPDPQSRAAAEEFALEPMGFTVKEVPSFVRVKQFVRDKCMIELKQASFPRTELNLVEDTPDCGSCPKRAGNLAQTEPENYQGVRSDICTDPGCFKRKTEAWIKRVQEKAKAEGCSLMPEGEQKRWFRDGNYLEYGAPYVDFAEQCTQDKEKKKPRSFKQLLQHHVNADQVLLGIDAEGGSHRLVHKDVARPILLKEYAINLDAKPELNGDHAKWQEEQRKAREAAARREKIVAKLVEQAAASLHKIAEGEKGLSLRLTRVVRELMAEVLDRLYGREKQLLEQHLGIKGRSAGDRNTLLLERLKKLGPDDVWSTAAALLAVYCFSPGNDTVRVREIIKLLDVDIDKAKQDVGGKPPAKKRKETARA